MKITFYDSGIGGLTIFNEAFKYIKAEYVYFADNLNTPYGIKSKETVKKIVINNVKKIMELGTDIIVIACNTATSAAINDLRKIFKDKCIIGTEPAVKVAVDSNLDSKKILVCATTLTSREEKIKNLLNKLHVTDKTFFIPLDELVIFAENLDFNSQFVYKYIKDKFSNINLNEYSHLVLGCTHFPLFKEVFRKLLPDNIDIIDSSTGVINNVKNTILKLNLKEVDKSNVTLILTQEDKKYIQKFSSITGINEFCVEIV